MEVILDYCFSVVLKIYNVYPTFSLVFGWRVHVIKLSQCISMGKYEFLYHTDILLDDLDIISDTSGRISELILVTYLHIIIHHEVKAIQLKIADLCLKA